MHAIKYGTMPNTAYFIRGNSTLVNQAANMDKPLRSNGTDTQRDTITFETKEARRTQRVRRLNGKFVDVTPGLQIRKPVTPTVQNIVTPKDHPLWQFFYKGKFIRSSTELDATGRSWDVTELRRKSFNDLHSLWYNCLKERNILNREIHLSRTALKMDSNAFVRVDDRIKETMWKIRHVLNEREILFEKNTKNPELRERLIDDFSKEYLDSQWLINDPKLTENLKRFQKVVFGINEVIENNVVNKQFIAGIKLIANLKLKKSGISNELGTIEDVGEAFLLFNCDNTVESVEESIGLIKELRNESHNVSPRDEISAVKGYINQLSNAKE